LIGKSYTPSPLFRVLSFWEAVVECLPGIREALCLIPSTAKKKKKSYFFSSQPKLPEEKLDHGQPANRPEDLEFSSFMFWRSPLPNIDWELQELLVRPWL
jgi:hypothetical protein